jgi:hypothetical protein
VSEDQAEKPAIPAAADPIRAPNGRWLPGAVANPHGRPKGRKNAKTILRERLRLEADTREKLLAQRGVPPGVIPDDATNEDLFWLLRMWEALNGNGDAWRDVADRLEAKQARTEIEISMPPRSPVGAASVDADAAAEYYADRDRPLLPAGDDSE